MIVASKQSGSFKSCKLVETLGHVAVFGTYLKIGDLAVKNCNITLKGTHMHSKSSYLFLL